MISLLGSKTSLSGCNSAAYHPVRQRIARAMSFSDLHHAAAVRRAWTSPTKPACRRAHTTFLDSSRAWRRLSPINLGDAREHPFPG